jgi:hypothetical protein
MTFETISPDPSMAAPIAPVEGADLLVKTGPHDESFWDQHPDIERYKVTIQAGQAQIQDRTVLVWLKPAPAQSPVSVATNAEIPQRPADAEFVVHGEHDMEFFGRHPSLVAWRVSLSLNEDGPRAVHYVQVWITSPTDR